MGADLRGILHRLRVQLARTGEELLGSFLIYGQLWRAHYLLDSHAFSRLGATFLLVLVLWLFLAELL